MEHKILYYLGAGASVKALPLAKSIWPEKSYNKSDPEPIIKGLAYALKSFNALYVKEKVAKEDTLPSLLELSKTFIELADKADEFGDVDTYAKYLNLMEPGGEEFQKLKQTLSQYFSIEQQILNARDSRYLPWLISIMNRKTFPDNIKILSWNYDSQVELAAAQFGSIEDVSHSGNSFSYSPSMIVSYPNIDPTFSDHDKLSLIHLNGIAGFDKGDNFHTGSVFQPRFNSDKKSALTFILENSLHSQLHFAWEGGNYHTKLMQHVTTMIAKTTIMVVIGYSFPFFNREVDKQIFEELKQQNSFRKIYYQDPVLNGEQLRSQFNLSKDISIVHIRSTDNFHIPFEY